MLYHFILPILATSSIIRLILFYTLNEMTFYLSTGTKLAAEEGQFLSGVNLYIPREDVAKFMLGCLDAESPWQRKAVAIGIPK